MTKIHKAGLFICLSAIIFAFAGFWIAGTIGTIEFSSQYFWAYVILPLVTAAAVTGLSWKWPFIGGCVGVLTPFAFFVTYEMETFYRYLYLAVIITYFLGGVLLLSAAIKAFRSR
jgi:hypothetical protein